MGSLPRDCWFDQIYLWGFCKVLAFMIWELLCVAQVLQWKRLLIWFDLIRSVSGICKVGNFMIWAIYRYVRRNHYRPLHLLRKKASPTPWFSQILLFSTRYTETNLEEQWRLPRYHFPNRSPCIAVEPLSHASPFWEDMKVKKDCEFKDMTCRFWMIS